MRYFSNEYPPEASGKSVDINPEVLNLYISDITNQIAAKVKPSQGNCDGGLYVGCAGIAYAMYYVTEANTLPEHRSALLKLASNYINASLEYIHDKHNRDTPSAFLLGHAGVYAAASLLSKASGDSKTAGIWNKKFAELAVMCTPENFLRCGSDEFLVGRAGYLYGCLMLNKSFGQVVPKEAIHSLCSSVVQSGRHYSVKHDSPCPLMYAYYDTEYLGAAHGLSGILQMLLCFPDFVKSDAKIEADIRTSVDFMLQIRQPNGNIAPAMDEVYSRQQRPASEELVHWCHGAPGVVYLFAKAYLTWGDQKYLDACIKCGELTWGQGLLKKGPGICHGVAGSGYVFLLLYRLTNNPVYRYRAERFAEFMQTSKFKSGARTPDSPYSLYEGLAGTMCFYTDLLQPDKAHFPMFDIF
ncbi:unnamed protein product [Owenia fusiformis]|uniref:Lancl1 protein n=1 Tax=Owenia fusiformis TaxID=6347 RepID=A0A8S4NLQ4_OWEFU|nr:unnamed protein product [Owenia fusiformis]